ncbi:MAG: hypothetical protein FJY20_02055 [Bacteroidetes bacterium]|nr:hypothetical protein [Bacteroidota bacterium]
MQTFEFTLKNEKKKVYDWFAIFLVIINGIAICIELSRVNYQRLSGGYPGLIALTIALLSLIYLFIIKNNRNRNNLILFASLGLIGFWIATRQWWFAAFVAALAFLYYISKRKLLVIVSNEYVSYPSFPVKTIKWKELNNLLLKDGFLTLDFKNNKVIQQLIDEKTGPVNEKEFNDFCKEQLRIADSSI